MRWLVLLLAGCGFDKSLTTSNPDVVDAQEIDAPIISIDSPPGTQDVSHLGPADEVTLTSNTDWTMVASTINTSNGSISPAPPAGVIIRNSVPQEGGGTAMVVQAGSFTINGNITISGNNPIIFVAKRTIAVSNVTIDASAVDNTPGPGGFGASLGPRAGGDGTGGSGDANSGGGGAGFKTAGGDGGNADGAFGGLGGATITPGRLVGGSGGGDGDPSICSRRGGAGGGGLQLSAAVSITFSSSVVNLGGGGGDRGEMCGIYPASAAGGGSGGMLWLESPLLLGTAQLVANGGGGGGAANAIGVNGSDGGDAGVVGGSAGNGALGSGDGGLGAQGGNNGFNGGNAFVANENGGGAGGGTGWIFYKTTGAAPTYTGTPMTSAP